MWGVYVLGKANESKSDMLRILEYCKNDGDIFFDGDAVVN